MGRRLVMDARSVAGWARREKGGEDNFNLQSAGHKGTIRSNQRKLMA
jgi:hypothetical protein